MAATANAIPLHTAVQSSDYPTARSLIENGCDVNAKDDQGRTVLMLAVTPQPKQR